MRKQNFYLIPTRHQSAFFHIIKNISEHICRIGIIVYARTHINKILGNTRIGSERKSERSTTRTRSIAFSYSCLGRSAFCFSQRARARARDQFRRVTSGRATKYEGRTRIRKEGPPHE